MEPVALTWVRLRAPDDLPRHDAEDFRDELHAEDYPGSRLVGEIQAATGKRGAEQDAAWERLGRLVLEESVTSAACDQSLHFAHPRLE